MTGKAPLGGRVVFCTPWFDIQEISAPDGKPYYRFVGPNAVVVFAVTAEGNVLLVRQYRPARGHTTLEIPAGAIEPGETPEEAARRELLEETGHRAGTLHALGSGGLRLDRDSATVHTFAAFDCQAVSVLAGGAECEHIFMPLVEFQALVMAGKFEQLGGLGAVLQALLLFGHKLPGFG